MDKKSADTGNNKGPTDGSVEPMSEAGDEIRTHDIHVGNVTLYH